MVIVKRFHSLRNFHPLGAQPCTKFARPIQGTFSAVHLNKNPFFACCHFIQLQYVEIFAHYVCYGGMDAYEYTGEHDATPPETPIVTVHRLTRDVMPTRTSGGGSNGVNQYSLDSDSGLWTETNKTEYTPVTPLSRGLHTLYVQERDNEGNWSECGKATTLVVSLQ